MTDNNSNLAISLFSEILTVDQLFRNRMAKILPKGMELSHFAVLNQLANINAERTPAQLAKSFHVTRGAMTNTLAKLEIAGYIHIRPDWEDARRKLVALSSAGQEARNEALASVSPVISTLIEDLSTQKVKAILPALRDLRQQLEL
ncbi:MAG: MarR family transcriptional regulator [Paracoccaceae bacterium]|jgi:DNA-binding MarR family transcriptional regulator|nr:MarR family transcriptional regulator [Paracoccaceae bacterium]